MWVGRRQTAPPRTTAHRLPTNLRYLLDGRCYWTVTYPVMYAWFLQYTVTVPTTVNCR